MTDYLTAPELAKATGVPYPTVMRYIKRYPDHFVRVGEGRGARYSPSAVEEIKRLRQELRPGRSTEERKEELQRTSLARRLDALDERMQAVAGELHDVLRELKAASPATAVVEVD